jgi:hypothetical protein
VLWSILSIFQSTIYTPLHKHTTPTLQPSRVNASILTRLKPHQLKPHHRDQPCHQPTIFSVVDGMVEVKALQPSIRQPRSKLTNHRK